MKMNRANFRIWDKTEQGKTDETFPTTWPSRIVRWGNKQVCEDDELILGELGLVLFPVVPVRPLKVAERLLDCALETRKGKKRNSDFILKLESS